MTELNWTEGPLLGFDLETDGPNPRTALPVSYALVLKRMESPPRMSSDSRLIDPGVEIPAEATAVHGLTTERCRAEGMPLDEAVGHIVAKLLWAADNQIPLVGMNLTFDLTIIDRLSPDLGAVLGPVIDLFVLDKHVDQYRKGSRKLAAMCEVYGVTLEDAHESRADVTATILCVLELARRYPEIADMHIGDLEMAQEEWRREQVTSLSDYFVSQGKAPIPLSEYEWPIFGPVEES